MPSTKSRRQSHSLILRAFIISATLRNNSPDTRRQLKPSYTVEGRMLDDSKQAAHLSFPPLPLSRLEGQLGQSFAIDCLAVAATTRDRQLHDCPYAYSCVYLSVCLFVLNGPSHQTKGDNVGLIWHNEPPVYTSNNLVYTGKSNENGHAFALPSPFTCLFLALNEALLFIIVYWPKTTHFGHPSSFNIPNILYYRVPKGSSDGDKLREFASTSLLLLSKTIIT